MSTSAAVPEPLQLTIGDLVARSGVPASTLRFYERRGLIASERTYGNQRRYTRDVLRRVAFIRMSQQLGIPLSAIQEALGMLPEERTPTAEDWARISRCWHDDLSARIRRMQDMRDRLAACMGCGCMSLSVCALANPVDQSAEESTGSRRFAG
ncbi:redox-sensitive transcriptional activator SoxR [Streptacidiphilus anmyonensis]|uniref:redox-sensitive transcriptional activator SoxR n=1 Tax=Streptacidiphilus anmyonensis TaxID=405782 RepID=UPI0005A99E8C|nr:redox-sensitive transcriptional activator SoxR [Streptacidiphilus anmyonensis]